MGRVLLGVDVGGTFTDAVLVDGDRVHTAKSPTTPGDQSRGRRARRSRPSSTRPAPSPATVDALRPRDDRRAPTRCSNAAAPGPRSSRPPASPTCSRSPARTGPSLYRLCEDRPPPLAPARAPGRGRASGSAPTAWSSRSTDARDRAGRRRDRAARARRRSRSACSSPSPTPRHERRLAAALRERFPGLHVSVSSEVLPRFREYERCATTVLDAYLSPLLGGYLRRLADRCREIGIPEPLIMQSSGGVTDAARARGRRRLERPQRTGRRRRRRRADRRRHPATATRSASTWAGPPATSAWSRAGASAGPRRASSTAARSSCRWSTSTRSAPAAGRSPGATAAARCGSARARPGAEPGPACYGRGGTEPTVTDAEPAARLPRPGRRASPAVIGLDREAAEARGRRARGRSLGLEPLEAAAGIVEVANQEMVRALRVITVERGIDPRRFDLLPFGGAGPLHAVAIADELGIGRVLCPRSGRRALGARPRLRRAAPRHHADGDADRGGAHRARASPRRSRRRSRASTATADATLEAIYELRYRGQSFELPVDGPLDPDPARAGRGVRGRARAPLRLPRGRRRGRARQRPPRRPRAARRLRAASGRTEAEPAALAGDRRGSAGDRDRSTSSPASRRAGLAADGPCVFELPETTFLVPGGWRAAVDRLGTIVADPRRAADERRRAIDPIELQVLSGGLRSICDEMGAVLIRAVLLAEHQGAPRLLDGDLRRRRRAGDAGRAHPRPPRLDAGRRRGGRRARRRRADAGELWILNDPYQRRHPPARHHAGLPARSLDGGLMRLGREPRPPRRRRRADAGRHAGRLADARRRGRGDRAAAGRRRRTSSRSPAGCAGPTSGSPTCGRSAPPTCAAGDRIAELAERIGRERLRRRDGGGPRLRRAAQPRRDRRARRRRLRGGRRARGGRRHADPAPRPGRDRRRSRSTSTSPARRRRSTATSTARCRSPGRRRCSRSAP